MKEQLFPLDDRPGPAPPIGDAKAKLLVAGALARALAPAAAASAMPPKSLTRLWLVVGAGVGILLLGGVGAVLAHRAPAPVAPVDRAVTITTAAPTVPPATSAEEVGSISVMDLPRATASAAIVPVQAPEDLLRAANLLRADQRWADAASAYDRVRAFRGTSEAYTASVASASIRLEHLHDPNGALKLYREAVAMRPHGDLDEEARYGVVECTRALGDANGERAAIADFLATHPDSPLAPTARARATTLEGERR